MNWIHYAYLSAFLSSVWSLSVKEGIMSSFSIDFTAWYALISTLISLLFNIIVGSPIKIISSLVIAGFFVGCSVICLTKSLDSSPNPGSSMAIFRTQAVFIALAAYLLFGSNLTIETMVAMIVVVIGVFIATGIVQKPTKIFSLDNEGEDEEDVDSILLGDKVVIKKTWPVYALLAALLVTFKDLIAKTAFHFKTADTYQVVFNILVGQSIVLIAYDYLQTGNFNLEDKNQENKQTNNKKDKRKTILITIWTGIIFFVYLISLTQATKLSSNVGYVKSIDTFGIIITTIASNYLFHTPLDWKVMLGIGMIFLGTLYISGFNIVKQYY